MKKEPMVFAAAGVIFGFVLGYMVATREGADATRAASRTAATEPSGREAPASENRHAEDLDLSELRALESLAARDKANGRVRIELGNLLMDHGRFEDAASWYREAVAIEPQNTEVVVDLGACLVNAGKVAEGLAEFERALERSPNHKKALFNKGIALMHTGRQKEAVAIWEGLLKRFPGDPDLRGLREQIDRIRAERSAS